MLCAGAPAGESPLVPLVSGLLTATETDAAMPTNLRGDNLVMQQLPRRLGFISAHFHWRKSVPHPVTEYSVTFLEAAALGQPIVEARHVRPLDLAARELSTPRLPTTP